MKMMGTDTENTLFVGDQLFTDVFGATAHRDPFDSGKTNSSERGDPDRAETVPGEDCAAFLSEGT